MKKILMGFSAIALVLATPLLALTADCSANDDMYSYNIVYPSNYQPSHNDKIVYLTFDDGPTKYTLDILNILAEHDVPATFFVVGNREHTHLMADIIEHGHVIGLHSYNHDFKQIYSSSESFFTDLQKIDDIVYNEIGLRSMILRFPGGSSVTRGATKTLMKQLSSEVQEKGYQYFDWNCDSGDKRGSATASEALSKIKSSAKTAGDIVIVLMHDTESITVQYLPDVIKYFKEQGYTFLPLTPNSPAIHHSW